MNAVDTFHPEYTTAIIEEWRTMRDAYRGEIAIKNRGEAYLPMPSGYRHHPAGTDAGNAMYDAYRMRARFPEIVGGAVRGMVGIAHGQEWQIDLPPALTPLIENVDGYGLPIEGLAKRITTELLLTGRYSLLADAPENGGDIYLAGYTAEELINWSEDDDFYALREVVNVRNGFDWDQVVKTRVLELIDGRYIHRVYMDGVLMAEYEPHARGGAALGMIPLAVGGAMDMDLTPDTPPLIGVARAAIAHYQLNADYRLQLYSSGQETLFIYNADEAPSIVGAGVVVTLNPSDVSKDVRAEYVGPQGTGMAAHVVAMDREQQSAIRSGAQLFDNTPSGQESGDARRLRFSAETATLSGIVNSSAAILERALKQAAIMAGANPDDVVVTPPVNLLEGRLDAQEMQALVGAWEAGAFGYQTLYENLQRGRIASFERTFEDELGIVDNEDATPREERGGPPSAV